MDTDGDGRISRQEWRGPPPRFDQIDANRDSYITLEELRASRAGAPAAAEGPPRGAGGQAPPAAVCDNPAARLDAEAWIDTQVHLRPGPNAAFAPALQRGIERMDAARTLAAVIMPQPFPDDDSGGRVVYDSADFAPAARRLPCRYAFLGGNALNQMLAATRPDAVTPELRERFRREANSVLSQGAAGFGQIALLHMSRFPGHPFQEVAPDHPLMLLLAEIAGAAGKVINVHMQVYERDGAPPSSWRGQNPARIQANVAGFERLLAHDRRARITLANFGEDPSGQFTLTLARRLLSAHSNLSFIVTIPPARENSGLSPFAAFGGLRQDWLQLVADFPDRFTIGSLSFFAAAERARGPDPSDIGRTRSLIAALPADVRRKLAIDNPRALYGLR